MSLLNLLKRLVGGNGEHLDQPKQTHIIIIVAGLTGLLLAQGLRKLNAILEAQGLPARYTFSIDERDKSSFYRRGGFSLTIHWALQQLYDILPQDRPGHPLRAPSGRGHLPQRGDGPRPLRERAPGDGRVTGGPRRRHSVVRRVVYGVENS
ncbi:hypothetical protein BDW62DRAFT_205760 [Aspergillus aurantiobrunneus]